MMVLTGLTCTGGVGDQAVARVTRAPVTTGSGQAELVTAPPGPVIACVSPLVTGLGLVLPGPAVIVMVTHSLVRNTPVT